MAIKIDGKSYTVVEDLGFSSQREQYAKVVKTDDGERIAVRDPGRGSTWHFSKPRISVVPGGGVQGQTKSG